MADAINVKATPIDDELSKLSAAEAWLAEASERVAERCKLYKPPEKIVDEDGRLSATDARTQVRKDAAEIDNERKVMLRQAEDALKQFKSSVKSVISPLTDLDAEYKRLLDEYEAEWKLNRKAELEELYVDTAPMLADIVPFDRIIERYGNERGSVWLNRISIVSVRQKVIDALNSIAENERTIDELVPEDDRVEVKAIFFDTLDINAAMREARRLKEQRERVLRLESERAELETMTGGEHEVEQEQPAASFETSHVARAVDAHAWYIQINGTRSDAQHVANVLRQNNVRFERICSGSTWTLSKVVK